MHDPYTYHLRYYYKPETAASTKEDKGKKNRQAKGQGLFLFWSHNRHQQHLFMSCVSSMDLKVNSAPRPWTDSFWFCLDHRHWVLLAATPLLALVSQPVQKDLNWWWSNSPQDTLQSADVCSNNGQLFQNKTACSSQAGYSALESLAYRKKCLLPCPGWEQSLFLLFSIFLRVQQLQVLPPLPRPRLEEAEFLS